MVTTKRTFPMMVCLPSWRVLWLWPFYGSRWRQPKGSFEKRNWMINVHSGRYYCKRQTQSIIGSYSVAGQTSVHFILSHLFDSDCIDCHPATFLLILPDHHVCLHTYKIYVPCRGAYVSLSVCLSIHPSNQPTIRRLYALIDNTISIGCVN